MKLLNYLFQIKNLKKKHQKNSVVNSDIINNLIATIDFLVAATEGIVEINKEYRSITNHALDINGVLNKRISSTYFDILEGK
ncbi:hypothetical protein [Vibrio fluvialis]|uniref:hypothetical protein n=1 Tax=Vibrio fluvialis TaxID=676 RepID=UPI0028F6D75F|nr:hypothetical protein [Vibrio fluvialis]